VTPKEIVFRAIERTGPPRLPIKYANRDFNCSDVLTTGWAAPSGFTPSRPGMTEWGYFWKTLDGTMGQTENHPLADPSALDTYLPPDPDAPGRFDHLPAWLAANRNKFVTFSLGISGFNQVTFLRGMEDFLIDLHTAPARAERIIGVVFDFECAILERVAGLPFDAVAFADDWGTQRGLIIDPALWRRFFRARYARQFALAHQAGKKVWFHSCGDISAIIPDLIDVGVDVLELLQPDLLGVERLARDFGGRVCFCCSIDHQRRAISGSREEIFAYARFLRDTLGVFGGGFIAYIEDYACLGMSEQTYQWIRQAFHALNPA